jgi:hypothetical protein
MENRVDNKILEILNSFFKLFDAKIADVEIEKKKVKGFLVWEDEEEQQEFSWSVPENILDFVYFTNLANYLLENKFIDGDKILVSKEFLCNEFDKVKLGCLKGLIIH